MGANEVFASKAPRIMAALIERYRLKDFHAAGILGNLGHESLGFTKLQEIRPVAGRGGLGFAQWTGPRRRDFEAYCASKRLDPYLDAANQGFLFKELDGPYARVITALRATISVEDATTVFEKLYEGAGVPAMNSRIVWARLALKAYRNTQAPHGAQA